MSTTESSQAVNGQNLPAIHLVPFHGDTIATLEHGDTRYVAMRRIVENMGLDWKSQHVRLKAQADKFGCGDITTPSAGGPQVALCMPVEKLALWLVTINPNKVRADLRDKVERYQAESAIALHDYWTKGVASRDGFDGTVTDLSPAVRAALGGIVKSIVHREVAAAVKDICSAILPEMLRAALAGRDMMVRRGKTAGQILSDAGFPPMKGFAGWFSRRLVVLGYSIEGEGRSEQGGRTARLFDPDKVSLWLRTGGRIAVEQKIAERRGQGVLRLVSPTSA